MNGLVAAIAACMVAALVVPGSGRVQLGRLRAAPAAVRPTAHRRRVGVAILMLGPAALVGLMGGARAFGWVFAGTIIAGTVAMLVGRAWSERCVRSAENEVLRVARTLAGLLRIGKVPAAALSEAIGEVPALAPVAATLRLGGDVVAALREQATKPGWAGLGSIAAAWQIGQRNGAPVAGIVDKVSNALRADLSARAAVATELAGARMTGRVMAVLPFAALGMGYLAGANPLSFLTSHWLGEASFVAGTVLAAAGVWWLESLARRVTQS